MERRAILEELKKVLYPYTENKELLEKSPVGTFGSDYQKESLVRSMDNAYRLLSSPAAKAFDLALDIHFLYPEPLCHDFRLARVPVEKPSASIE